VRQLADNKKKKRRNTIILMAIIWFVVTLPLPWIITGDVGQNQLSTLLPIIGFISIPFVVLGIAWTLKPELTT
jgi:MFS-type transporter involved in bile tolerance (Atg22 family)